MKRKAVYVKKKKQKTLLYFFKSMHMSFSNLYSLLILYCSKVINEERERENDREMALHSATK